MSVQQLEANTAQLDEQVNNSAELLIATFGWNDLAIHQDDMKAVVKNHLRMINEAYIRMLKQKKQSLMHEIRDKIQHSSLSSGCCTDINHYKNGGCYAVTGVIVSDSFGNKFEFNSKAGSIEYNKQTGYTRKWFTLLYSNNNSDYIPSYLWPQ